MRKIILTYGLISGTIVSALIFSTIPLWRQGIITFDNGEIAGYTTMVISLSMIFFGVRSCRDYHFKGSIGFWQSVKIGMLITLIASVMYALAWEISIPAIAPDFTERIWQNYLDKAKSESADVEAYNATVTQVEQWKEWYKNPLLRFVITMTEILPVGIVITFISAALLRKKAALPVQESN